jgi:hypothetical protein
MAYQQNNKRQQNNYFTNSIKQGGENFLDFKNSNDMKRDAIRMFRDLARGKINIAAHGHYLLNNQFLESCIAACQDKLEYHGISYKGISYMVSGTGEQSAPVMAVLDFHRRASEAYTIIMNGLLAIKATGDANHLVTIVSNLNNYRNHV